MNSIPYLQFPINPVILGKIGAAYGIHGWLKVFSFTEKAENIFIYQPWFIRNLIHWQKIELESWKHNKQNTIVKIKDIDNRRVANLITNYEIIIDSGQLPKLQYNEYYWKDLIGCKAVSTKGCNFGYVYNLLATGSNDVLIIKSNIPNVTGTKEWLIPFLSNQVVKDIDLVNKIIEVDWDLSF